MRRGVLRLYENNVQFYIRDLRTVCRSLGCHGNKPVWILAAGGGDDCILWAQLQFEWSKT